MQITLLTVGKIKEKYFKEAIEEYSKRLSRYCRLNIIEVEDEKTPDGASDKFCNQIMSREGERLTNHIPEGAYVIALAIEGKKYDSVDFSEKINSLAVNGKSNIVFIIGGSLGIASEIKKRADELISFSDMTFPHQLMRVILLEQVYRAYRIMNNEPYHK